MAASPKQPWPVIGHHVQVARLRHALETGQWHHAYLFTGPAHIGKATVARLVLATLLGVEPGMLSTHPDMHVLARGLHPKTGKLREQIALDQVQDVRARLERSSFLGGPKALLIEDAHLLSPSAANALLKLLEEPRGSACFILTSTHADQVLPTIRSRTQVVPFSLVAGSTLQTELEARGIPDAPALSALAAGAPGRALTCAQDEQQRAQEQERYQRAQACLQPALTRRLLAARELIPTYQADHVVTRTELLERLAQLEVLLRDRLLEQTGGSAWTLGTVTEHTLTLAQTKRALTELTTVRERLAQHLNPKLTLTDYMLTIN